MRRKAVRTVRRSGWVGMVALVCVLALQTPVAAKQDSPLGVNFWFLNDWETAWPFVDFFKTSRAFWPQPVGGTYPWSQDGVTLDLDSDGYPTSLPSGTGAATLMFWGDDGHHPEGNYTCLYDGDGDITFAYNASVVSSAPGRIVVFVEARDQGTLLKITRTNPANPVKNIRFIAPGFEATYDTQVFHPLFVERLTPFKVLRFMDWMGTNEAEIENWADRPLTTWQRQTDGKRGGVAVEHLVQLCNMVGAEPYFCMPCGATDDYVRQFATLVRGSLRPDLRIYVEYANEVWNGMFRARGYCSEMGNIDLGKVGADPMDWGSCVHWWTKRSVEMFAVWEEVFGGTERLVRVMGTQIGNRGVADAILTTNSAGQHADALAVAPYFGATGSTVDAVIANLTTAVANKRDSFVWARGKADEYNVSLICYESGLDMFRDPLLTDVRRDPRLKQVYLDYFGLWKECGGELMVHYTFCDPVWGLFEWMDQDTGQAPSYQAAIQFIYANPLWWGEEPLASQPQARAMPLGASQQYRVAQSIVRGALQIRVHLPSGRGAPDMSLYTLDGAWVAGLRGDDATVSGSGAQRAAQWCMDPLAPGKYIVQFSKARERVGEALLTVK